LVRSVISLACVVTFIYGHEERQWVKMRSKGSDSIL